MSNRSKTILVLDSNSKFISKTTPAKARMMLKNGNFSVFNTNPFMIKQNGEQKGPMPKRQTRSNTNFVTNWTKFFAEEAEIYIQNLTTTNVSITLMQDGVIVPISIPCTRKPLNLTQFATFDSIKNSLELRKMVNRKPAALRLITEEEYEEYFDVLSKKYNTDPEKEMMEAQDQFAALMNKRSYKPAEVEAHMIKTAADLEDEMVAAGEPDPRIVGLCERSSKDMGDERITQRQFLEELEIYEDSLTSEDWDYIASMVSSGYHDVKSHALSQIKKSDK